MMEALSPDQNNFRHLSKVSSLSSHFSPSSSSSSSPCGFDSSSDVEQRLQNNNLVGKRFYVSRVETPIFQQKQPEKSENKENGKNNNIIEFPDEIKNKKLNSEIATNHPNTRISDDEELITFRYTWPVKITERLISLGETAILNVSPPFCTAYNGVQFTWLLRICEENILDIGGTSNDNTLCNYDDKKNSFVGKKKVNITLYYKDGPARDVRLHGGEISILNSKGLTFEEMPLRELEYIKGGGWSPIMCVDNLSNNNNNTISAEQLKFIEFIHSHVGRHISVRIKLEMPVSLFQPLQYLPSIDSPLSNKLEALCAQVLEEIRSNQLKVPDVEFFDPKADKYALYRHVYLFACQVIFERFADDWEKKRNSTELKEKISNIFAHYYFNKVIVTEAECFEDFLEALDASMHVQFPALRRECERYICAEVIAESTDLSLAKKMLVLAARFNLTVLKMVSFGVIVDRLLLLQDGNSQNNSNSNSPIISDENTGNIMNRKLARASEDSGNMTLESSMDEIREELLEIAEKINVDHNSNYHLHSSSDNIENSKIYQNQQHKQLKFRRQHSNSLCSPTSTVTPQFPNITKSTTFLSNSALLNDKNNEEENEEEEEEEDDSDEFEPGNETLVGTVVAQLEQMARYIRKVSMPPGTSPAPLSAELINQNNNNEELIIASSSSPAVMNEYNNNQNNKSLNHRRSSLMTCREMLLQQNQQKEDENTKGITKEENATNFFSQLYAGTKLNNNTIVNSDCNSEHLNERQQHKCSLNEDNKNNSFNKLQHTPRAITISNKVVVIDEVSVCSEEIRRRSSWKNEDDEGVDVFEEDND